MNNYQFILKKMITSKKAQIDVYVDINMYGLFSSFISYILSTLSLKAMRDMTK